MLSSPHREKWVLKKSINIIIYFLYFTNGKKNISAYMYVFLLL